MDALKKDVEAKFSGSDGEWGNAAWCPCHAGQVAQSAMGVPAMCACTVKATPPPSMYPRASRLEASRHDSAPPPSPLAHFDLCGRCPRSPRTAARLNDRECGIDRACTGLMEIGKKEELAAEAGMLQSVAELEKLEVDVVSVSTVTIAEILEREPELRAKIEDEIKNNVWAP